MIIMIYNTDTFDYSIIGSAPVQKRRKGNQGRRDNKRKYKDLYCAFDIECSNDPDLQQAFMYIWQFQIEEYTIIGRTCLNGSYFARERRNSLNRMNIS